MSRRIAVCAAVALVSLVLLGLSAAQQTPGRGQPQPPPPTLGLDHGTLDFDTPGFTLRLVKDSQTIAALEPKGAKGIDAATPLLATSLQPINCRRGRAIGSTTWATSTCG